MAIVELNRTEAGTAIGVWEISEPTDLLLRQAEEAGISLLPVAAFRSEIRKAQWAAVRLLLKTLLGEEATRIIYDDHGKPHLSGNRKHISISHSRRIVAVIVDPLQPTGIDVEFISPKVKRIEHKFLNKAELEFVEKQNETEQLLVLWGAKEALYKAHGKKKMSFRENLLVYPFCYEGAGIIRGKVCTPELEQEFSMRYEKKGEYMLVYLLNN